VTSAYGIRTVIDNSVEEKNLHFNLENVDYQQAMAALAGMANVFLVPIDETSVLVAKDDQGERQRFERQVEETIFVPGSTTEEIGDLTSVMKNVFDVKQVTVQPSSGQHRRARSGRRYDGDEPHPSGPDGRQWRGGGRGQDV